MAGREEREGRNVDDVLSGIDRWCIMGGKFMLYFMKHMNFKGDGFGTLALNLTRCSLRDQTLGSYFIL
jgi:hypothetical protein